jgi:hypothetical protein
MNEIEIFKQELKNPNSTSVGEVAILRGGLNMPNPKAFMDDAVAKYVKHKSYNEFVEVHLDNPWVRVVITGINELVYDSLSLEDGQR